MLKIGQKIFVALYGAGEVTSIGPISNGILDEDYIEIEFKWTDTKYFIPISRLERCNYREVMDLDELLEIIKEEKSDAQLMKKNSYLRLKEYNNCLESINIRQIIKVYKTLTEIGNQTELSVQEQEVLEKVKSLLCSEVSISTKLDKNGICDIIKDKAI